MVKVERIKPLKHVLDGLPAEDRTTGQKVADGLTKFAGSWTFIIILFIFIGTWIFLNLTAYVQRWDPWPFIILNLCLSTLAAVQAPIILMSQNRAEERDRRRSAYDYQINRRAYRIIDEIRRQLALHRDDLREVNKKLDRINKKVPSRR